MRPALVFVLFSFAAPAQTLETWIAAYYFDDLDCSGKTTQQSTVSTQMIAIELLCATLDEVNVAIARPYAPSDDKLTVDDTIEPGAVSNSAARCCARSKTEPRFFNSASNCSFVHCVRVFQATPLTLPITFSNS
jgi:hypothetical protein